MKSNITETMDQVMTEELAKVYIVNWKNISAFFDKKTLAYTLKHFKLRDFAIFDSVPAANIGMYNHYVNRGYIQYTAKPVMEYVTEYSDHNGGGWERRVQKLCHKFVVTNRYQLAEKDFLKMALEYEFPYLMNYEYQAYHMDEGCTREQIEAKKATLPYNSKRKDEYFGAEIYVKMAPNTPSVYVPFIALKERNPDIIINRHTTYHSSYYQGSGREEARSMSLNILEHKETQKFFVHVIAGL